MKTILWSKFMTAKMVEHGDNLNKYIFAVSKNAKGIENLRYSVLDEVSISALFDGLDGKYKDLTSRIVIMKEQPSFEGTCAMLQEQNRERDLLLKVLTGVGNGKEIGSYPSSMTRVEDSSLIFSTHALLA